MTGVTETVTVDVSLRDGSPWSAQRMSMVDSELLVKLSALRSVITPLVDPIAIKPELATSEYLHTKYASVN